ncbi:MAG: hypothetical protein Q9226_004077 [Calogaya cf. arnoldii]
MVINEREDQKYDLKHHHFDTFTWLMSDEEEMKRGRFIQSTKTYKIEFWCEQGGEIRGFNWPEMGGMSGYFTKESNDTNPKTEGDVFLGLIDVFRTDLVTKKS